jgi:hypothetical protein
MTPTVYIVSGFPRSGTSMMMRCAEAGGIPCVHSTAGDADRNRNTLIPGYVPNPHGFYEGADLDRRDWSAYAGHAVKVMRDDLALIPPGVRCRVAYMTRDPVEIRRSYYGILSGPHPETVYGFLDGYRDSVQSDLGRLAAAGHEVTEMAYAEVVADPAGQLARLGWPMDVAVAVAAAVVDPALYRHRGAA